jgi:hypothetical protein
MAKLAPQAETPLFYGSPVPLDRSVHRNLRAGDGSAAYGFARDTHVIPALVDEFSPASREMPIVFLPSAVGPTPVFMVGLETGRNSFVDADGRWSGNYVPAYLRRYPFILGESEGQDPIICIDAGNTVLSETAGEPLFTDAGEPAPALETAIHFANEYFAAGKRTEAFVKVLQDLDLFRPITIESRPETGNAQTIYGLLAIDEPKIYELSEADFLKLRDERLLAPIFAHFFSLSQVERLRQA